MTKMTKAQAVAKAQGMADYEERVMVVGRYADDELFIRAAEDLDVDMVGDDWMDRYGLTYCNVVAPAGYPTSGKSATDILREVVR